LPDGESRVDARFRKTSQRAEVRSQGTYSRAAANDASSEE
jgi:hypothetical protein